MTNAAFWAGITGIISAITALVVALRTNTKMNSAVGQSGLIVKTAIMAHYFNEHMQPPEVAGDDIPTRDVLQLYHEKVQMRGVQAVLE